MQQRNLEEIIQYLSELIQKYVLKSLTDQFYKIIVHCYFEFKNELEHDIYEVDSNFKLFVIVQECQEVIFIKRIYDCQVIFISPDYSIRLSTLDEIIEPSNYVLKTIEDELRRRFKEINTRRTYSANYGELKIWL